MIIVNRFQLLTIITKRSIFDIAAVLDLPLPNKVYVYYLPHRPVIGNDRETSKIRIVFDVSAKFKNEKSLNNVLVPQPCLLLLLFNILFRFRTGKIRLTADIKQAFLQIEVTPEHRDFLRFM